MMLKVERVLGKIITTVAVLAGICIVLMMLHVTADVALRYGTGSGVPGTLTIVSYYYMVVAAFVPLAYAEYRNAHIQMELVTDMLPMSVAHWLRGLVLLGSGAITAVLAVRGFQEAMGQMASGAAQVQGTSRVFVWPSYFALPVGAGLMTLLIACRLWLSLAGPRSNTPAGVGVNHE